MWTGKQTDGRTDRQTRRSKKSLFDILRTRLTTVRNENVVKYETRVFNYVPQNKHVLLTAWVSNPRPARLYYAAGGHICELKMHYQNDTRN
jgi:hypothetical protein